MGAKVAVIILATPSSRKRVAGRVAEFLLFRAGVLHGTRVFVHRGSGPDFSRGGSRQTRRRNAGSAIRWIGRAPGGRVISEQHMHTVSPHRPGPFGGGGALMTGGMRVTTGEMAKGILVAQRYSTNCRDEWRWRAEISAPVMSVWSSRMSQEEESSRAPIARRVGPWRPECLPRLTRGHTGDRAAATAGTCGSIKQRGPRSRIALRGVSYPGWPRRTAAPPSSITLSSRALGRQGDPYRTPS